MSLSPTIIHATAEVIIIGGLSYMFNKRMNNLELRLEEMEKVMATYERIIINQQRILETMGVRGRPSQPPKSEIPRDLPPSPPQTPASSPQIPPSPADPISEEKQSEDLDSLLEKELSD